MNRNVITCSSPALIIFTVDMSGSMSEKIIFEGNLMSKCDVVSQIVNISITELIGKCCRGTEYKDYFNLIILGYCGSTVISLLEKFSQSENYYVTPSDLIHANVPAVNYVGRPFIDGKEVKVSRSSNEFVKLISYHTTPMYAALCEAYSLAGRWRKEKGSTAVPPFIINITDGEASDAPDGQLIDMADRIKGINTNRGKSTLVNIHISGSLEEKVILFPSSPDELKGIKYAELLYEMSSELTEEASKMVSGYASGTWQQGTRLRAVAYNTSPSQLFNVLQIGSLSVGL